MIPHSRLNKSLENRMGLRSMEDIPKFNSLRYLSDLAKRKPKLLKRSAGSLL